MDIAKDFFIGYWVINILINKNVDIAKDILFGYWGHCIWKRSGITVLQHCSFQSLYNLIKFFFVLQFTSLTWKRSEFFLTKRWKLFSFTVFKTLLDPAIIFFVFLFYGVYWICDSFERGMKICNQNLIIVFFNNYLLCIFTIDSGRECD